MNARFLRLATVVMIVLLAIPSSSLSHLPARLGDSLAQGTLAALACTDWNLASDFRVSPNQENPNRDSCGNLGVWHFMSADLNRQAYALLPYFTTEEWGVFGLESWEKTPSVVPDEYLPVVGINASGSDLSDPIIWPVNTVRVHPSPSEQAVVGWRSTVDGEVSVTGSVVDLSVGCGDGIVWTIDRNAANLASGSISDGGAQDFGDGAGGDHLANISVGQGDMLYFAIGPGGDYCGDSTRLDISIHLLVSYPLALTPPTQTGEGAPGEVVAYQESLTNNTGSTDSFSLSLGAPAWDSALSASSVGPLDSGTSLTFTVYVTVPLDAPWYRSDVLTVTATSVTSPTLQPATATLTTQAYAPPSISISPGALTSTQYVNQIVTQSLTISNGNGVTLTFSLTGTDSERLVLWNKLGSDEEVMNSEVGEDGIIVGSQYAFEPAKYGYGYVRKYPDQHYLAFPASVLDPLHERGAIEVWVNSKVPCPIMYQYGDWGLIGGPPYGNTGGPMYFNVWLIWGDESNPDPGFRGGVTFGGQTAETNWEPTQFMATPFVPFHAAICWDIAGISGSADTIPVHRDGVIVSSSTGLWDPSGTVRYDIVLGIGADGANDKFIVDNIKIWNYAKTDYSDRFVEAPGSPQVPWLSTQPVSGTVAANSSQIISFTFDATDVGPGTYTTTVTIQSNDPLTPTLIVLVTMTVSSEPGHGWVEGSVTDARGAGIQGVTLSAGGSSDTTDADGHYNFYLPAGTYTLTPSCHCFAFSPPQRVVAVPPDVMGQDFRGWDICTLSLPIIMRNWPPLPGAPTLNPIVPQGHESYDVSWTAPANATAYTLQEDADGSFSNPTTAYDGPSTAWHVSGKAPGTYCYRVRATNQYGHGPWSNGRCVTVVQLQDDFSNPNSGWPVSSDAIASLGYESGEYRILVKQANYIVRAGPGNPVSDFQCEADARNAAHLNGSYGIYFGSGDAGFYLYDVAYGQFRLLRYERWTNNWATLIAPTQHSAIRTGNQTNRLKVVRQGAWITLYANGVQVGQAMDGTFGQGTVGIAAGGIADNYDARFDNFLLLYIDAGRQDVGLAAVGALAQPGPAVPFR